MIIILKKDPDYNQWKQAMIQWQITDPLLKVHRLFLKCSIKGLDQSLRKYLFFLDLNEKAGHITTINMQVIETSSRLYFKLQSAYEKSDYDPCLLLLKSTDLFNTWYKLTSSFFGFRHRLMKRIDQALIKYVEHCKTMQHDNLSDCLRELLLLLETYHAIDCWLEERSYISQSTDLVWTLYSLLSKQVRLRGFHCLYLIYCVKAKIDEQLFFNLTQAVSKLIYTD